MSLGGLIRRLLSVFSGRKAEQRYDHVEVVNVVDGTKIKGHDAVKAYFEREENLYHEHGPVLIFQVYRMNLQADTIEKLQGQRLAEITVDGDFVSGVDTVAAAKEKVRFLIREDATMRDAQQARDALALDDADRLTFYLGGRPMADDTLFYADNFILLPAWVQVMIHRCESDEILRLVAKLAG